MSIRIVISLALLLSLAHASLKKIADKEVCDSNAGCICLVPSNVQQPYLVNVGCPLNGVCNWDSPKSTLSCEPPAPKDTVHFFQCNEEACFCHFLAPVCLRNQFCVLSGAPRCMSQNPSELKLTLTKIDPKKELSDIYCENPIGCICSTKSILTVVANHFVCEIGQKKTYFKQALTLDGDAKKPAFKFNHEKCTEKLGCLCSPQMECPLNTYCWYGINEEYCLPHSMEVITMPKKSPAMSPAFKLDRDKICEREEGCVCFAENMSDDFAVCKYKERCTKAEKSLRPNKCVPTDVVEFKCEQPFCYCGSLGPLCKQNEYCKYGSRPSCSKSPIKIIDPGQKCDSESGCACDVRTEAPSTSQIKGVICSMHQICNKDENNKPTCNWEGDVTFECQNSVTCPCGKDISCPRFKSCIVAAKKENCRYLSARRALLKSETENTYRSLSTTNSNLQSTENGKKRVTQSPNIEKPISLENKNSKLAKNSLEINGPQNNHELKWEQGQVFEHLMV